MKYIISLMMVLFFSNTAFSSHQNSYDIKNLGRVWKNVASTTLETPSHDIVMSYAGEDVQKHPDLS